MKLLHWIQEKLADRVSFVQYPNLRPADQRTRTMSRTGWHFAYRMPLATRAYLLLMSLTLAVLALALLAVLCFLTYTFLFQGR